MNGFPRALGHLEQALTRMDYEVRGAMATWAWKDPSLQPLREGPQLDEFIRILSQFTQVLSVSVLGEIGALSPNEVDALVKGGFPTLDELLRDEASLQLAKSKVIPKAQVEGAIGAAEFLVRFRLSPNEIQMLRSHQWISLDAIARDIAANDMHLDDLLEVLPDTESSRVVAVLEEAIRRASEASQFVSPS